MFYKLSKLVRNKAVQKEAVFRRYPFARNLKTHKLQGKFDGYSSFYIDYDYRIIFRFIEKDTALFIAIGDHSIYQ